MGVGPSPSMEPSSPPPGGRARVGRGGSLGPSAAILATVVGSLAIWVVTGGDLLLSLLPVAFVTLLYSVLRVPLHITAASVLFLVLATDDPKDHPAMDQWRQPLYAIGLYLFENLNNITGILSLRFSGVEVLLVVLLVIVAIRRKDGGHGPGFVPVPRPLKLSVLAMFLTLAWLEVYGLARGGDFKSSLWQIRQLLWVGPVFYLFSRMLRGPADVRPLGAVIIAAGLWKAALGLYYYEVVCRPLGIRPAHVNTHGDTILYVTAMVVVLGAALHERSRRSLLLALCALPPLLVGTAINNRRLAYVSLAASMVAAFALLPRGPLKRKITLALLVIASLTPIYVAIGRSSNALIFMPAAKVMSLFSEQDSSAGSRDIENWNLVNTVKAAPLLGQGFGHEYDEIIQADSITEFFSLYRYIPHNSVLWQWLLGGLVGFTLLWVPLVIGAYFAIRAYRHARQPDMRAAALTCLCVIVAHEIQQYGDMGSQYWMSTFMFPAALAMAGKLALKSGAWPGRPP